MPHTGSPLHAQATALRRSADRLALLRLRLNASLAALTASTQQSTSQAGKALHEQWTNEQHPLVGAAITQLRALAQDLDEAALAQERSSGRRMGGYAGAGFLGRGTQARQEVQRVHRFVGSQHGQSIGWGSGTPDELGRVATVLPSHRGPAQPHPSQLLGESTPPYEDD